MQYMKNLTALYLLPILHLQNFRLYQSQSQNGNIQIIVFLATEDDVQLLRTFAQLLPQRIQPIGQFYRLGNEGEYYFSDFRSQSANFNKE